VGVSLGEVGYGGGDGYAEWFVLLGSIPKILIIIVI
jgi:hypothetical protein